MKADSSLTPSLSGASKTEKPKTCKVHRRVCSLECNCTSSCCKRDFPFLLISLMRVKIATLISCSTRLLVSFTSFILEKKNVLSGSNITSPMLLSLKIENSTYYIAWYNSATKIKNELQQPIILLKKHLNSFLLQYNLTTWRS